MSAEVSKKGPVSKKMLRSGESEQVGGHYLEQDIRYRVRVQSKTLQELRNPGRFTTQI